MLEGLFPFFPASVHLRLAFEYVIIDLPVLVVNHVSKARSVDNRQRDLDTILIKFFKRSYQNHPLVFYVLFSIVHVRKICREERKESKKKIKEGDVPTVYGLILMPSSIWAISGSSHSRLGTTSASHKVLMKVVRPRPEAPAEDNNQWRGFK